MKIDVGGGNQPKIGYANVDKYSTNADYQADFINLPFPNNSIVEDAGLKVTRSDYILDHAVQSIIIEGVKNEEKMV